MLGFAQNMLWRAYQILLCGTAIGINASLEFDFEYAWVWDLMRLAWAFPLGFAAAWYGTIATQKIIERLRLLTAL